MDKSESILKSVIQWPRFVLRIIQVLSCLFIIVLIIEKLNTLPRYDKYFILSNHHINQSLFFDWQEMDLVLCSFKTTAILIFHIIAFTSIIRDHYWIILVYSLYLSSSIVYSLIRLLLLLSSSSSSSSRSILFNESFYFITSLITAFSCSTYGLIIRYYQLSYRKAFQEQNI